MGQAAFLAVAAFVVIGGIRANQHMSTRMDGERRDAGTRFEMLARSAALFGYERGKQALVASTASASADTIYQEGRYRFTMTHAGGVGTIRATGSMTDASGRPLRYKVVSTVQRELTLPGSAPVFMQFALLAQDNLTLSGNMLIDTFRVAGDTRAPANANIHTNGTLKVNGGAALVRGFGTYTADEQVGKADRVFKPYHNPTNAAVLLKASAIPMPTFTPQAIANALVPNRTSYGSVTLSGTMDFAALGATRDNPYVWHIKGSVTAGSNVSVKGYVIFLVDGSLELSGGETVPLNNGFAESNAAWYTGSDITFRGNSEIWGQFYTGANIHFSGTPNIYGSVTTRGAATLSGNPSIYYVPGSPALAVYWQAPTVRLHRLTYSEGW